MFLCTISFMICCMYNVKMKSISNELIHLPDKTLGG